MVDRLLTPRDVANLCQVSTKTVLRAIHRGDLRASRLGEKGAYRMYDTDVEEWINRCVVDVQAPRRLPVAGSPRLAAARTTPHPTPTDAIGRLTLTPEMGRRN